MRKPKAFQAFLLSFVLLIPALAMGVAAPHVGLDADTDGVCDSPDGPDMGVWATAAEAGNVHSFDLFFEDFGDILSFGCIFCVKDETKITNWSWSYGAIGGWTADAIKSGATVLPFVTLDLSGLDNPGCFQVQATDYTFSAPLSTSPPLVLGTFTYEVAGEGAIDWVLDESSSALNVSFTQVDGEDFCPDKTSAPPASPVAIDGTTPACPLDDLFLYETWPSDVIFTATGGTGTYAWTAIGLPVGMSIDEGTGQITGVPEETGGFGFDVTVNDVVKESDIRHCSLFVLTPEIVDSSPTCPIPNGQYGVPYPSGTTFTRVKSSSAVGGFEWDATGLPDGMSIGAFSGEIEGAPTEIGVFPFTVFLTDGVTEKTVFDDRTCQITVDPILIDDATPPCPVPSGDVGVPYLPDPLVVFQIVEPIGYAGVHHWSAYGTPNGMGVDFTTGTLEGTPSESGNFTMTVVLLDQDSNYLDTRDCPITINAGGVDVNVVPPGTANGEPDSPVSHYFTVTNTGASEETFTLDAWSSQGYATTLPGGTQITVAGGMSTTPIEVVTDIPGISCPTEGNTRSDTVYMSASMAAVPKAATPPLVYDEDSGITTIDFPAGVDIGIADQFMCQDPGATNRLQYYIQNTGYCIERFNMVPTLTGAPGWSAVMVGGSVTVLGPLNGITVYVDVTAPPNACNESVTLTVTATGEDFGATDTSDEVYPCTNYIMAGTLSDEPDQNGLIGETVNYCFTVENTGPCFASFGVAAASTFWPSSVIDPDLGLNPGETGIICVSHEIPAVGTIEGESDSIVVVLNPYLVAKGDLIATPDTVVVKTTAIEPCVGAVDVYGGIDTSGPPGASGTIAFTIKNMGNKEDRFSLFASSNEGWNVWPDVDLTGMIAPDGQTSVNVNFEIPEDALCDHLSNPREVSLWAVSECDDQAMDADTALVGVMPIIIIAIEAETEDSTGLPGQVMDYVFNITNNGNCEFPLLITRTGIPADWPVSEASSITGVLGPDEILTWTLSVTIPPDAVQGDEHTLTVCAQLAMNNLAKTNAPPDPVCASTITRVLSGCVHEQPILSLGNYETLDYTGPNGLWTVQVKLINNGPGMAKNISMEMDHDIAWLGVNNSTVFYGDLNHGESGYGESAPRFIFDLAGYPGGSFNVWFDVTYEDECGSPPIYQVRLDPTFINPEGQDGPVRVPSAYQLHQNMPNPFNPHTTIAFDLPAAGYTDLTIYNTAGQVVRQLWNGNLPSGPHAFAWDGISDRGTSVPSGTYFYNLRSGDFSDTRRMVLVR